VKKFFFDNKINFLFLFISFIFLIAVIGIDNINFQNTGWLYKGNDSTTIQLGWYFFLNDDWRFPLGSNPNYGEELGNSIVFSDSIPILALFFKLFKSFIPGNFQYFSFWFFICFYLQLFFSFKILKKFTNSTPYSLIGSIFFLISPILIFRVNYNHAEAGQWLLLCTLYLFFFNKVDKSKSQWFLLMILSLLISYNFTVVILIAYSFLRIFIFFYTKENFFKPAKDFFILALLLLLTLYIVGYFQIRPGDALARGFGVYKLNLLSMFDPVQTLRNTHWSLFLPDIKLSKGEELEGFNYFGLGGIMMLLFALFLFLNKRYKANLFAIKSNKEIKVFIIVSLFLTFWALSNKISFGSYTLVEIPLNKYIYAALSIAKSTGRHFWIVNYFLLILSIIIVYKCFKEKNSILILTLFLLIQLTDTSAGLKTRINLFNPTLNDPYHTSVKNSLWDELFEKYKIVRTTLPINYLGVVTKIAYKMEKHNIEKTNLVMFGRGNRKAAAEARYYLYDNFNKKRLPSGVIYLIHNSGHLNQLRHLFEDENVGFFYRDNIWVMVKNEKERMNDNDKKMFSKIKSKLLETNKKENLSLFPEQGQGYFNDVYYGFGWSHDYKKQGVWSEGPISTLLFSIDKNYEDLKLEIICRPYLTKKNKFLEFDIYVNNLLNQSVQLINNNQDEKIEILFKAKIAKENEIRIDFSFKNPISPYEVLETPDSRKLGILIKSIKIIPKTI
jgi:hypothetical protein